jgi:RNA-binding protein
MKKLTTKQKCDLRGKAHSLKPVIIIGSHGLTVPVYKEIDSALEIHELIKIRVNADDKNDRKELVQKICEYNFAELIQLVGHVATIYRTKFHLSPKLKNISLLVRKIINIVSKNEHVKRTYIFGSRAKGEARDVSDIDIAIDCPEIENKDWTEIYEEIKNLDTLLSFDIIRFDKDDENLQREILKHGIKIYG